VSYNEWLGKRQRGQSTWTGLYSKGMHSFILRETEIGFRAAAAEDDEACGLGPLIDYMFEQDVRSGRIS